MNRKNGHQLKYKTNQINNFMTSFKYYHVNNSLILNNLSSISNDHHKF